MEKKLSILLVEDDQAACKQFLNYINNLDDITLIEVTNNTSQAIDYVKYYLPDAIILDLEFHNGNGNGLMMLQKLKAIQLEIAPYILITTNNSSQVTYEAARQLGADFIMSKHQVDYSVETVINFFRLIKSTILARAQSSVSNITPECPELKYKKIIRRICVELDNVGISPKAIGYKYLIDAIQLVINNPMPNLCTDIAKKYNKSDASVERAMQNAINKAWRTADIEDLLKHYTARINTDRGVPTITEFIYYFANKIKTEL